MKIGIYGGTFNPPHLGHLTAAAAVIATLKLDKLLLIPASIPPHKDLPAGSATAEQRLEMTRMAGEQLGLGSKVETLDMEVRRAGKSFTSDTLAELKAQFPEDELWLLMGTDMFLSFETWHEPEKIASLAGIAAFGRTKADMEPQFSAQRDKLYRLYPDARIFTLTVPGVIDISSTELREQLASRTGENLLPPAVYGYILRNHLYGTDVNLKSLTLSQLRPVALSYLKYKRIPHVLGTEQEAIRLATRYGADVEKARVAALLHDCTKKLDMPEQLALCRQYGIELDELEQKALKLLHAKTGAAIAREVFGVDDEIYRAIWWHTTGHAALKYCNGAETFYTYAPQRGKAGGQMAHTNTYGTDTGKKFQLANVKDVIGDFASYGSDPRRTQYAGSETWNFTKGKRNAGGISGAEPIKK